jgi:hypothetical protein
MRAGVDNADSRCLTSSTYSGILDVVPNGPHVFPLLSALRDQSIVDQVHLECFLQGFLEALLVGIQVTAGGFQQYVIRML